MLLLFALFLILFKRMNSFKIGGCVYKKNFTNAGGFTWLKLVLINIEKFSHQISRPSSYLKHIDAALSSIRET